MRAFFSHVLVVLLAAGCTGGGLAKGDASADVAPASSPEASSEASSELTGEATVEICQSISTEYHAALEKAAECTLGAAQQCMQLAVATFYCRCEIFVNGGADVLSSIDERFQTARCPAGCAGACADTRPATCQPDPTSSTGARCVPIQTDTAVDAGADAKEAICGAIRAAYGAAVQVAEECKVGAPQQCTQRVSGASAACQCPFIVNDNLSGALYSLDDQFRYAQCSAGCLGPCPPPGVAICQPDPTSATGGRCGPPAPDAGP
jgi:hypothetical protein